MKTGTKLHFYNINNSEDKIEEFFIGGALPYEKYTDENNLIKYGIIYRPSKEIDKDLIVENKEYVLTDEDFNLFVGKTNIPVVVTKDGAPQSVNYRKIIPVYNIYSLKQNLESRCTIIKGELPYNVQHGIPLKAQLQDIQLSILNIINNTPGVRNCEVLSSKLVNRKFKLEVKIKSIYGTFTSFVG